MGVIDEVIPEPLGAAHRYPEETGQNLKEALFRSVCELKKIPTDELVKNRYNKFRSIGRFKED